MKKAQTLSISSAVLVIGVLLLVLCHAASAWAQAPAAIADLYQGPGASVQAVMPSSGSIAAGHSVLRSPRSFANVGVVTLARHVSTSRIARGRSSAWGCAAFGASSAEWLTARVEVRLVTYSPVGFQVILWTSGTANYWGQTLDAGWTWVEAEDHDRSVSCEVHVRDDYGSAQGSESATIVAEDTPHVEIASDSGDSAWNGVTRRDIWYQIRRSNGAIWPFRGTVSETMTTVSNPCNIGVQTGSRQGVSAVGQFPDTYFTSTRNGPPEYCTVELEQRYTLSTSNNSVIRLNRVVYTYGHISIAEG
jgi:hypothetical protein